MRCIALVILCLICVGCSQRAVPSAQDNAQATTELNDTVSAPTDIIAYTQMVGERVRSYWHYVGRDKRIWRCTMFLLWNDEGALQTVRVETPSGNEHFDASALRAVQNCAKAGALPPPPLAEGQKSLVFIFSNAS